MHRTASKSNSVLVFMLLILRVLFCNQGTR
jgi:hypothetical protein